MCIPATPCDKDTSNCPPNSSCINHHCHEAQCSDTHACTDPNFFCDKRDNKFLCEKKNCTTPGNITEEIDNETGEKYKVGCDIYYQKILDPCDDNDPDLACVEGTCDSDTFECNIGPCDSNDECGPNQHCVTGGNASFCTQNNCETYGDGDNCHNPDKYWCEEGACVSYNCTYYTDPACAPGSTCEAETRKCVPLQCNFTDASGTPRTCSTGYVCDNDSKLCFAAETCNPDYTCPDQTHVCTKTADNPPKYLCHETCSDDPADIRACHPSDKYDCEKGRCLWRNCKEDKDCHALDPTDPSIEDLQLSVHCIDYECEAVGCIDEEECNDKWSGHDGHVFWMCKDGNCEAADCLSDTDCTGSHPFCDTTTKKCRAGCSKDEDCPKIGEVPHRCDTEFHNCEPKDCYPGKACEIGSVCSHQFIYGCPLKEACNSRGECVVVGPKDHEMIITPLPGHWAAGKHDTNKYLSFKLTHNLDVYKTLSVNWNQCEKECSADDDCISALHQIDKHCTTKACNQYDGNSLHCHLRKTDKLLNEGDIQYDSRNPRSSSGYQNRLQFELITKKFITDNNIT
jgi:hypothetical protein